MYKIILIIVLFLFHASGVGAQSDIKEYSFQTDASTGNGTEADVTGMSLLGITVVGTGGSDRIVSFQIADTIGTYTSVTCSNIETQALATQVSATGTTPQRWECSVGGFKKFRTPVSGGTTGTVTVKGLALSRVSARGGATVQSTVGPGGSGNVISNETLVTNGQLVTFSGTDGVHIGDLTLDGIPFLVGGVPSTSNVSNDAQLKRSAGDYGTFPQKITPQPNDRILVEDPANGGVKGWISVGSLPEPPTSFSTVTSGTSVSSTLVVGAGSTLGTSGGGQINATSIPWTVNGHPLTANVTVTAGDVGLGSVTNDAQLKRSANDWVALTEKTTPVGADMFIVEDSAAGGNKVKVRMSNISGGPGGGTITAVGDCTSGACTSFGNVRIKDDVFIAGTGSSLVINTDTYEQVQVPTLIGTTTISIQGGMTPTEGQILVIGFSTPTAVPIIWSTGAGQFSSNNGVPLPTTTLANQGLVLFLRYNSTANRWAPILTSNEYPYAVGYSGSPITVDINTTRFAYVDNVNTPTVFNNPQGNPTPGKLWRVSLCSSAQQALSWGSEFRAKYNAALPLTTTGGGLCDLFGFQRSSDNLFWDFISTTQGSVTALQRTCMMVFGRTSGSILTDAELAEPVICTVPFSAQVIEIEISSDVGTPAVMVHRRVGGVNTPLLVSSLATGAAGASVCARTTAITGYRGNTCVANLQNTNWAGLVDLGTSSGTASTAHRIIVRVHYILTS